jgi:tetratricopeptide (TPR) repeat protein
VAISKYSLAKIHIKAERHKKSMADLGVFYKEINEYDKAIEYFSRELKIRRKLGDSNAMQLAEILQFLGSLESLRHNRR